MRFFTTLNERNIDYVLLRWWHDLPAMPEGEDMDILMRDEQRDLIADLLTFRNYGTDLKCDIYTVAGENYGSHKGLPYFQNDLANRLLKDKCLFRGVFVPFGEAYFASLAYHALFHKGDDSGLAGFSKRPDVLEHDYSNILRDESLAQSLELDISVRGIYYWLAERNFLPAEDTLTKLVEIRPELSFLQRSLYSDVRGGEFLVFVIRERLVEDRLMEEFVEFLKEEFKFEMINVRVLNEKEKAICKSQIRGGKWDNGPYKLSGGAPVAFVSAFDPFPHPLDDADQVKQPRMTNRNNFNAKYRFREHLNRVVSKDGHYNGLHSADNELDARSYLSFLDQHYSKAIEEQVEIRRQELGYTRKLRTSNGS